MLAVTVLAVGRLRRGPEAELVSDYLERAGRTGRGIGLGPFRVTEIEDRSGGSPAGEAAAIRRALPTRAAVVALDERGEMMDSIRFSKMIADLRDSGRPELCLVIGGADGLDPALRAEADRLLSFGPMVWPHMLARVMLAEQLYRATSILSGGPYHRA